MQPGKILSKGQFCPFDSSGISLNKGLSGHFLWSCMFGTWFGYFRVLITILWDDFGNIFWHPSNVNFNFGATVAGIYKDQICKKNYYKEAGWVQNWILLWAIWSFSVSNGEIGMFGLSVF